MLKRILIAEDEALTRKSVAAWLRTTGYDVAEAKDGAEAIDLLDTSRFDLVLSDIRMPRIDGIAVLTHLRAISPRVPFIVLSAYVNDADRLLAMHGGVIMQKPVTLEDLERKIRSLL